MLIRKVYFSLSLPNPSSLLDTLTLLAYRDRFLKQIFFKLLYF
jgi:hypothetical protein